MGISKVYFTDMRALPGTNLPEKLKKLIRKAGIGDIDFEKKYTAIKMHFGEPGNLSFLRPATPCIPGGEKTPWSIWVRLMRTGSVSFRQAAMSSSATG